MGEGKSVAPGRHVGSQVEARSVARGWGGRTGEHGTRVAAGRHLLSRLVRARRPPRGRRAGDQHPEARGRSCSGTAGLPRQPRKGAGAPLSPPGPAVIVTPKDPGFRPCPAWRGVTSGLGGSQTRRASCWTRPGGILTEELPGTVTPLPSSHLSFPKFVFLPWSRRLQTEPGLARPEAPSSASQATGRGPLIERALTERRL